MEAKMRKSGKLVLILPLQASARSGFIFHVHGTAQQCRKGYNSRNKKNNGTRNEKTALHTLCPHIILFPGFKDPWTTKISNTVAEQRRWHAASGATAKTQPGMGKTMLHATKCLKKLQFLYIPSDRIHRNLEQNRTPLFDIVLPKVVLGKI